MPPPDVNVVRILAGGINYDFFLAGEVFQQSVDQFPGKIVIGDQAISDQTLASEWVFIKDLRDGAGIKYHRPGITDGRFWAADRIDTRFQSEIHLTGGEHPDTAIDADVVWAGELGLANYTIYITDDQIFRRLNTGTLASQNITGHISGLPSTVRSTITSSIRLVRQE
jgi:hypothetical protein